MTKLHNRWTYLQPRLKDKLYFRKLPRKIIHIDLDKCYNDNVLHGFKVVSSRNSNIFVWKQLQPETTILCDDSANYQKNGRLGMEITQLDEHFD